MKRYIKLKTKEREEMKCHLVAMEFILRWDLFNEALCELFATKHRAWLWFVYGELTSGFLEGEDRKVIQMLHFIGGILFNFGVILEIFWVVLETIGLFFTTSENIFFFEFDKH